MIHAAASLFRAVRTSRIAWARLAYAGLLALTMFALSTATHVSLFAPPASPADALVVAPEALRGDDAPACVEHPALHAKLRRQSAAQVQTVEARRICAGTWTLTASRTTPPVIELPGDALGDDILAAGPLAGPPHQLPPGHAPPRAA